MWRGSCLCVCMNVYVQAGTSYLGPCAGICAYMCSLCPASHGGGEWWGARQTQDMKALCKTRAQERVPQRVSCFLVLGRNREDRKRMERLSKNNKQTKASLFPLPDLCKRLPSPATDWGPCYSFPQARCALRKGAVVIVASHLSFPRLFAPLGLGPGSSFRYHWQTVGRVGGFLPVLKSSQAAASARALKPWHCSQQGQDKRKESL